MNRCVVLSVDEDRSQTRAIHDRQRAAQTLEGLLGDAERARVVKLHQDAQRLLRPVLVANPYAPRLGFADERTRTRRDHMKYLGLIRAVALLHQHQRPRRTVAHDGQTLTYVEVTLDDIALASRLAHEVLGRSLDDLAPQTRRLLGHVDDLVRTICATDDVARADVRFTGDDLGPDRLAHGYAVTVHRSQGATVDTAHCFADGGGRELGYVAMSRARGTSHAYVVADDVATAVEDLARDWSAERRQLWAIDSGTPATSPLAVEQHTGAPAPMRAALTRARLVAERDAVAAAVPADPHMALGKAAGELARLRQSRFDLECGRGTWAPTPAGLAARELLQAQNKGREATEFAARAEVGWRMRRSWRADASAWAAREHEAKARFAEVAGPELDRLDTAIAAAEIRTAELHGEVGSWEHWQRQHPEAGRRLARLEADIARLDRQLAPEVELEPAVGWDLRLLDLGLRPPAPEPPGHDHGLGLGL